MTSFDREFIDAQYPTCGSTQLTKKQEVDDKEVLDETNAIIGKGGHPMEWMLKKMGKGTEKMVSTW